MMDANCVLIDCVKGALEALLTETGYGHGRNNARLAHQRQLAASGGEQLADCVANG